jgi:putative ABC transport system ATP-binding protein
MCGTKNPCLRKTLDYKGRISVLEKVGMSAFSKQPVWSLSGGQKQRTAIARALINEPNLILADEPTGALDEKTTGDIMQLFTNLNQMGHTIVIITHDPVVARSCSRVLAMRDGVLAANA